MIGFILITLVVTMPFLQTVFKVQTLNIEQLMIVYGLALANLPIIQIIKKNTIKVKIEELKKALKDTFDPKQKAQILKEIIALKGKE